MDRVMHLYVTFLLGKFEIFHKHGSKKYRISPLATKWLSYREQIQLHDIYNYNYDKPNSLTIWRPPSEGERYGVQVDRRKIKRLRSLENTIFPARQHARRFDLDYYLRALLNYSDTLTWIIPDTSFKGPRKGLFIFDVKLPFIPEREIITDNDEDLSFKRTIYAAETPQGRELHAWGLTALINSEKKLRYEGPLGETVELVFKWHYTHGGVYHYVNGDLVNKLEHGTKIDLLHRLVTRTINQTNKEGSHD